jgi:hypothetical protein
MIKHINRLWLVALLVGWAADFLFWKKAPGISFAIYVVLCLAAGLLLAWSEGLRPAWRSLALIPIIIGFAAVTTFRQEPLTVFVCAVLALALMILLVSSFLGGRWLAYGVVDHLWAQISVTLSAIGRVLAYATQKRPVDPATPPETGRIKTTWRRIVPILRGVLIALPIVAVFAALLASADLVFSKRLADFIDMFRLEKLPEYLFRLFYIAVLAYLLAGIFLHALTKSRNEKLVSDGERLVPAFFGFTEAAIVLGSVAALFTIFVIIQFQYFFGGQANINIEGYTYAEYARRGFGELVLVALGALLLFLGLSSLTRRQTPAQRWTFSGLGVALLALVAIILASAFQRLLLLEEAYGFTRLRTYPHVFMVWLGLLLLAVVILELAGRERYFSLAALLAVFGFCATLAVLNVDGFIADRNIQRAQTGERFDDEYIKSLSDDAVPTLLRWYDNPSAEALHPQLGGLLACRAAALPKEARPWQSLHFSQLVAARLLTERQADLSAYPVRESERGGWEVQIGDQWESCLQDYWMD